MKAGEYMGLNMGKEHVMDCGGTAVVIAKSETERVSEGLQSMLGHSSTSMVLILSFNL